MTWEKSYWQSQDFSYLNEDEVRTWHKSFLPTFCHNPHTQIPTKIQYSTESKHHLAFIPGDSVEATLLPGPSSRVPVVASESDTSTELRDPVFSDDDLLPPWWTSFPRLPFSKCCFSPWRFKLGLSPNVSSNKHDWLPLSRHWLGTTGFD